MHDHLFCISFLSSKWQLLLFPSFYPLPFTFLPCVHTRWWLQGHKGTVLGHIIYVFCTKGNRSNRRSWKTPTPDCSVAQKEEYPAAIWGITAYISALNKAEEMNVGIIYRSGSYLSGLQWGPSPPSNISFSSSLLFWAVTPQNNIPSIWKCWYGLFQSSKNAFLF